VSSHRDRPPSATAKAPFLRDIDPPAGVPLSNPPATTSVRSLDPRSHPLRLRVEVATHLLAPPGPVWDRAMTAEGINGELWPWLRMTVPPGLAELAVDRVPIGIPLGRSWLLIGGLLPIDFDDICIRELEPGRRFLEQSRMATFRAWTHERTIEGGPGGGAIITDRLGWEPRSPLDLVPLFLPLVEAIVRALFRHRHRRLVAHWCPAERGLGT
jgi:hypothetical protein